MSLVKKPEMTEKKVAANRQNQKLCNGPVTDERRERIRAALRRFGFDAQKEEIAMRALGEEPAHFQELLEGLWEEWNPAGALQEGVVIRLARALWLMNRADRMQEGYAVRQAQEVSSGREDRRHAQMMQLKMTEESLRRLAQSVAHQHYVTTPADLEKMKSLHQEGVLKDMGEIALALFYQLQPPGTGEDALGPRRAVAPCPPTDQGNLWSERGRRRPAKDHQCAAALSSGSPAGLRTLPRRRNGRRASGRASFWRISSRGKWRFARRSARPPGRSRARVRRPTNAPRRSPPPTLTRGLMRRMQDSNLREVRRLTNLLLKIKRYERQREGLEKTAALHDVPETKGVSV